MTKTKIKNIRDGQDHQFWWSWSINKSSKNVILNSWRSKIRSLKQFDLENQEQIMILEIKITFKIILLLELKRKSEYGRGLTTNVIPLSKFANSQCILRSNFCPCPGILASS